VGKRSRQKPEKHCIGCQAIVAEMFRVKYQEQSDWILVCKACQETIKAQDGYPYGGTRTQAKRN
jgi:rRNA maturation endonuclease Nob1